MRTAPARETIDWPLKISAYVTSPFSENFQWLSYSKLSAGAANSEMIWRSGQTGAEIRVEQNIFKVGDFQVVVIDDVEYRLNGECGGGLDVVWKCYSSFFSHLEREYNSYEIVVKWRMRSDIKRSFKVHSSKLCMPNGNPRCTAHRAKVAVQIARGRAAQ